MNIIILRRSQNVSSIALTFAYCLSSSLSDFNLNWNISTHFCTFGQRKMYLKYLRLACLVLLHVGYTDGQTWRNRYVYICRVRCECTINACVIIGSVYQKRNGKTAGGEMWEYQENIKTGEVSSTWRHGGCLRSCATGAGSTGNRITLTANYELYHVLFAVDSSITSLSVSQYGSQKLRKK